MDHERTVRMRQAMAASNLDALVVRLPENVLLLSGFWPMIGATTFVFPTEGSPVCIAPECYRRETEASLWEGDVVHYSLGLLDSPDPVQAVHAHLAELGVRKHWKRIGYEANCAVLAPSWNSAETLVPTEESRAYYKAAFHGSELCDATALLYRERGRKTAYEAGKLRIASEISCFGLNAFEHAVDTGVSGIDLVAMVEQEIMRRGAGYKGATRVRAYAQVATGPRESSVGFRPNEISTTRALQDGDIALLELGVVADGFWADRTRVRVAGNPTDEQIRVYEIVRRAQESAIATIRPGVSAAAVDEAARSVIRDAGYGAHFPHITGHGLGFGYHEASPKLMPGSIDVLEEGMLTSVEPGVYLARCGGIRIEDDVLVTADGAEVLGPFDKSLD